MAKAVTKPLSLLLADPLAKGSASPFLQVLTNKQKAILHAAQPKKSAVDEIIEVVPRMNGGFKTVMNLAGEDVMRRLLELKERFADEESPLKNDDVLEDDPKELQLHEPKTT